MTRILINNSTLKAAIFLFALVVFGSCSTPESNAHQVCLRDICYEVEIAKNEDQWATGLMHRSSLENSKGMLFVFPYLKRYSFWMKNTLIPLDIIWMDEGQRVIHIEKMVMPCEGDPCPQYTPADEALYVLELNAGEAQRSGINTGDRFEFHLGIEDP